MLVAGEHRGKDGGNLRKDGIHDTVIIALPKCHASWAVNNKKAARNISPGGVKN